MDDAGLRELIPAQARARFRAGLRVPTASLAPGFAQANLVVLPQDAAGEFALFASRNPGPCPLLDVTGPGSPVTGLAAGADLRTDLPGYRVWEHGACVAEPDEVTGYWRDDLVAFLTGCSFTFERALAAAGVPVRHVEQGTNVPMYRTGRPCHPAGRFAGPLVVSMRPVPQRLVATAAEVTGRYPAAHGAPVHAGDPAVLGIANLSRPDYGDPVALQPGDVPVFWACGVTPQAALAAARLPFAITHAPGHMLITDVADADLAGAYPRAPSS
ncbi:MAG TPA: putative hydro-lyase [Streptosporangiaceae bacterium]|nr:putative hydro-lyase [Streptosporangiaceae bacterium]